MGCQGLALGGRLCKNAAYQVVFSYRTYGVAPRPRTGAVQLVVVAASSAVAVCATVRLGFFGAVVHQYGAVNHILLIS